MSAQSMNGLILSEEMYLTIKHIVRVCVCVSRLGTTQGVCVGERERTVSDIALCNGGTNWSQTGQGTRPKTTSPTDGPQHGPWGRAEKRGVIHIWIRE